MSSRNQRRNKRQNKRNNQNQNRQSDGQSQGGGKSSVVNHERSSTETKASFKSTEFLVYVGAVLAVIMTALAIDEDGQGGTDPFGVELALRYITFLTIGYMISRGLAKAGSHESYRSRHADDTGFDDHDDTIIEAAPRETTHADASTDDKDSEDDAKDVGVTSRDEAQRAGADHMDGSPHRV